MRLGQWLTLLKCCITTSFGNAFNTRQRSSTNFLSGIFLLDFPPHEEF